MVILEERFYNSAISFFNEFHKPDWEKRKFELVKDIYSRNADSMTVDDAIDKADEIINKLKKKEGI